MARLGLRAILKKKKVFIKSEKEMNVFIMVFCGKYPTPNFQLYLDENLSFLFFF